MQVTVHRIDGQWFYDQDTDRGAGAVVTQVINVPDGSEFIDLVDCSRPEVPLHALRMKFDNLTFDANAHILVMLADMPRERRWPGIWCVVRIV